MNVYSFPPVINDDARVLVLGSMPGTASLEKLQYYGHPRNHFWPVLYGLFGLEPEAEYERRLLFAAERGIALWDVIAACERKGSLDANIRGAIANDLPGLLQRYPAVRALAFNGSKAYETFAAHYAGHPSFAGRGLLRMPSTSPIPTRNMRTTADRINVWKELLAYL